MSVKKVARIEIHSVDTFPLYVPLQQPYGDANGLKTYRSCYLFRLRTRSGLEGWGECVDSLAVLEKEFHTSVIPYLVGKQSTARTTLVKAVEKWHPRIAAGVSMALTEIIAQQAGLSVSDLWGGALRTEVPVYASFQSYSDRPDWMQHSLTLVEQALANGFTQLKVKVGGKPYREDREHITALTGVLGAQGQLALDANASYDRGTALRWNELFANSDQWLWFEEPMPMWRISEYRMLRGHSVIPLAGGENMPSVRRFLPLLQKGALDMLNPDVLHVGGVDAFRETLQLARHYGFRVSPHCYDGPLTRLYALIAQACLPAWSKMSGENIEPVEWDVMENPLTQLFPLRPQNGAVTLPTGSGLGVTVDENLLQAYRWDGLAEAR